MINSNHFYGLTHSQIVSGLNSQSGNDTLPTAPTIDTSHPWLASPWDDLISGGAGTDVLHGTSGHDLFVGGGGNDTFVIVAGGSSDTIADFVAGPGVGSVVNLQGYNFASFAGVQAVMTQNGADTVLNLGNGETLTFKGVQTSAFAADDFSFGSAPPDTTPPTLSTTSPADNSTNVAVSANLVLTFSESVKAGSGNVVIHNAADGSVIATIAITDASQVSFAGSTLTINPTSDLVAGTHYYVTMASGVVQDLAGNAYAGLLAATDFDFTTAPQAVAKKSPYDFDGDGHSGILWQNDSGQAAVWLMNGTNLISNSNVGTADPTWHAKSAGDFDGDGKADILLQNDSGQAAVWLMNGTTLLSSTNVGSNLGTCWHVKSAGDFNGDGKADILWQNDSGQAAIWLMNGTTVLSTATIGSSPGTR